ncbi:hypothetical protein JAAARDRAFT_141412, partial [Jaapia argillacea MUCL 33604]
WLRDFYQSGALISTMLRVIHPTLYDAGQLSLTRLMPEGEEVWDVLKVWPSVYSTMSVISNHLTPPHWDTQPQASWYDLHATVGPHPDAIMEFPRLGLRLSYLLGTVVAFSGILLCHCVPANDGNNICYVYYMQDKVHEREDVEVTSWMTLNLY